MSFLTRLFNKKEHTQVEEKQEDITDFADMEEDAEDTSEDDILPEEEIQPEAEAFDEDEEEYEIVEREILPTKIICPDCGGITLEGLEFCDKCGGEL